MQPDETHMNILKVRLSNERARYAEDNSEIRKVWIAQIEREIDDEYRFLGLINEGQTMFVENMSDDELLRELQA